ncbi:MAG: 2-oxoglutarate and iron-dependent oxygenase domain-containing protein, partial [Ilumatobacter sp.]
MTTIPTVDLSLFATGATLPSPESHSVAEQIDAALREVGFLLVVGHGLTEEVKADYFDKMREFFALPIEEKETIAIGRSPVHRGYVGMGT